MNDSRRAPVGLTYAPALVVLCVVTFGACARPIPQTPGPDSAPAQLRPLLARGDQLRGEALAEDALTRFRQAIQHEPDAVAGHMRYIGTMLSLGRRAEVQREYEERAARPDAGIVDRTMAQRLQSTGASSALRRVYTVAAKQQPQEPWWQLALAEVEIAEADAWNQRRLDAMDRGDQSQEREAFAQARGAAHRADRAVQRAADVAPNMAEVELYRGLLRATEGDLLAGGAARAAAYRASEAALTRATQLDADLAAAWEALGDVRFRLDDLEGSLVAYLAAARHSPADASIRESLGVVLHEIGRHEEAAAQYRTAARLRPWDASLYLRLGDAYADGEQWERALDAYDRALHKDPGALDAHYKMGVVLEFTQRPAQARAAYERYVDAGGPRSSAVQRRIDRLLRQEDK